MAAIGSRASAEPLLRDARAVQGAGAFGVVLEMAPSDLAGRLTRELDIPPIGIGAGPDCEGHVLVWQNAFGRRTGRMARFVKQYADLHGVLLEAARGYADDVRTGTFPGPEHTSDQLPTARGRPAPRPSGSPSAGDQRAARPVGGGRRQAVDQPNPRQRRHLRQGHPPGITTVYAASWVS